MKVLFLAEHSSMSFKAISKVGDGNENVGNIMKDNGETVNFISVKARLMTILKSKDGTKLQVCKSTKNNHFNNSIMSLDK